MVEATLGFDGDRIKRTEIAMIAIGAETKQHLGLFEADHPATAYARQCKAKPAKARAKQCDPAVAFRLQPVGEAGKLVGRTGTEKRMAPDHLRCDQAMVIPVARTLRGTVPLAPWGLGGVRVCPCPDV